MRPVFRLMRAVVALAFAACAGAPRESATSGTQPAITAADLRTRLFIFADDSMQGRQAGTEGGRKAAEYLAAELRRLGLEPAGENGTYFQELPLVRRSIDSTATITVDARAFRVWRDFAPVPVRGTPRDIDGAEVVRGGTLDDPSTWISPERAAGKAVVLDRIDGSAAGIPRFTSNGPLGTAAAVIVPGLEQSTTIAAYRRPTTGVARGPAAAQVPAVLVVSREMAASLGTAAANGTPGRVLRGRAGYTATPAVGRNVIAVLPGRDVALRGQYVALGAHPDHVGIRATAVDHDSMRVSNAALFAMRVANDDRAPTAAQRATLRVNLDSARAGRAVRLDSISNGADDDGSGSVAMLEIAEAMVASGAPRRSVLFVWHDAEEIGLVGARWFTDNPTVPRDSIVAMLNMDMVGRGGSRPGAGDDYLQLVGSRRLSTQLGDLVEEVNRAQQRPFTVDYTYDADGHPERIYCRSDHAMYARYGIPVVFFTTGLHGDYHQVTDEPQYIDYPHFARVTRLVHDVALRVANADRAPVVDKPTPANPGAPCVQ